METLLNKLKTQNPDLKLAEIEGILYILKNSNAPLQLQELIIQTGIPSQTLKNFLSSLIYIDDLNKIELNNEGISALQEIDLKPYSWSLISFEDKELEEKITEIRNKYELNYDQSKREYDQFFATVATTVNKANIVAKKGLLNKSIAIIGDDDLVSVALCLKYKPFKVTVFEIDQDLINALNTINKDYNLNIEIVQYDVRENIAPAYQNRFDVVLTDPPYTSAGIEIFLDRAVILLKKEKSFEGNYIFLYYGNSFKSPEKFLQIQDIFNKYNLVIEDTLYKFSRYVGAQSIGGTSNLYILKITEQTFSRKRKIENIYTYQEATVTKFPYVEHYTMRLGNIDSLFFKSINVLDKAIREFCKRHGLKIVDNKITKFTKGGNTFVYILSNSNLSVHTWPEMQALHFDLLVCSKVKNANQMIDNLVELFKTENVDLKRVE